MATDELPPDGDGRDETDDAAATARSRARQRREGRGLPEQAPRERQAEAAPTDAGRGHGERGGLLSGPRRFIRECWAELDRVQWPTRSHLWQATAVVLIACIIVGVYLYALDSVFTRAARWLVDQQTR